MLALTVAVAVSLAIWSSRCFGIVATTIPVGVLALLVGAAMTANFSVSTLQALARSSGQAYLENSIGRSDQSSQQRATIIDESLVLLTEGGVLGWGPRATKDVLAAQQAPYANEAHDDYLAAVLERGVLGAAGLLLLIVAIAWRVRTLARRRHPAAFDSVMPYTAPIVGAIIGMAVFATNEQILHFRQVWALFAVIAAYHLWSRQDS
jgi:O-antigen ligase